METMDRLRQDFVFYVFAPRLYAGPTVKPGTVLIVTTKVTDRIQSDFIGTLHYAFVLLNRSLWKGNVEHSNT